MATRKVIMFGGAGTTEPVPDVVPGVERWGMNALIRIRAGANRFKHCTRWFDLHTREHIAARKEGDMWSWYQKIEIPVMMWETHPDIPMSRAYPLQGVTDMFRTRLFCSGLDWQIACALYEEFEEIELYGFRMGHPHYVHQVGSGRWWLKQCADRGVKVTHLSPSKLASIAQDVDSKPPRPDSTHLMYGLETTDRSKLYRGR